MNPFARLDKTVEGLLDADLRLIYGIAVPMLIVCAVIFVLAFDPSAVWVALALVLEVAGLVLIIVKVMAMVADGTDG
jgi:ABC-type transport system involved in cytochrome bd biosynthesis fused ATPase/permease subunit